MVGEVLSDGLNGVVLSGMRPTGQLHIGHFEAVLRNWVDLQNKHECFYFVADWHASTTKPDTNEIPEYAIDNVKDWIAFGVDPEQSVIFAQSHVSEHFELATYLMPLVNYGRLLRLPTFKGYVESLAAQKKIKIPSKIERAGMTLEEQRTLEKRLEEIARSEVTAGFLIYPIVQAADILLYGTTDVPVGEDQIPHVELTAELAKKFNNLYGEAFVVPKANLIEVKRVRGIDGRKMSKSYANVIFPGSDERTLRKKVRSIRSVRPRLEDKGDPFECPVFDLHQIYSSKERELEVMNGCKDASISCGGCKQGIAEKVADTYADFQRRKVVINDSFVKEVLVDGNKKAQQRALEKISQVRDYMSFNYAR